MCPLRCRKNSSFSATHSSVRCPTQSIVWDFLFSTHLPLCSIYFTQKYRHAGKANLLIATVSRREPNAGMLQMATCAQVHMFSPTIILQSICSVSAVLYTTMERDVLGATNSTIRRHNTSKYWFCYLRIFTFAVVKNFNLEIKPVHLMFNVDKALYKMRILAILFEHASNQINTTQVSQVQKLKHKFRFRSKHMTLVSSEETHVIRRTRCTGNFQMKGKAGKKSDDLRFVKLAIRPTGQLQTVKQFFEILTSPCSMGCKYSAQFDKRELISTKRVEGHSFLLQTRLRLNMTILELETVTLDPTVCLLGKILIESFSPKGIDHLVYCGKHSLLNIFPTSNEVLVWEEFSVPLKDKKFKFTFFVMDQHTVLTMPLSTSCVIQSKHFNSLHFILWNLYALIYQEYIIKARHFQYCVITNQNESTHILKIWDGPGRRSDLLKGSTVVPLKTRYISSTSTVFLLYSAQLTQTDLIMKISVHSLLCHTMRPQRNNIVFSMPPSENLLSKAHCMMLWAPANQSVNATLFGFKYAGDFNTVQCPWAGVAAYNALSLNIFQQITVECVKIVQKHSFQGICHQTDRSFVVVLQRQNEHHTSPRSRDSKSIYSTTNALILVWYSFKEYGNISVNVSVSFTTCKVKTCHVQKCQVLRPGYGVPRHLFEIRGQCTILQVVPWPLVPRHKRSSRDKYFEIYLDKVTKKKVQYQLSAAGNFEGKIFLLH